MTYVITLGGVLAVVLILLAVVGLSAILLAGYVIVGVWYDGVVYRRRQAARAAEKASQVAR